MKFWKRKTVWRRKERKKRQKRCVKNTTVYDFIVHSFLQPQGRRLTSQRSMPRIPVAEPNVQLTPETKRRIMKEIEINVCL